MSIKNLIKALYYYKLHTPKQYLRFAVYVINKNKAIIKTKGLRKQNATKVDHEVT